MSKDLSKLTLLRVLEEVEKASSTDDDNAWSEINDELWTRPPFDYLQEKIDEFEGIIQELQELKDEIKTLKSQLGSHMHADGKIYLEY